MFCAVLALASHLTLPVEFGSIDLARARVLSGRLVVAEFLNFSEPYADFGLTFIGPQTRDDGAERVAVLRGTRYDMKAGERVRMVGVLRVIDHPASFVRPVLVPPWSELRVEE